MDPYALLLAVIGISAIGAAMLPRVLKHAPFSAPIVYLGLGLVLFSLPIGLEGPRVGADIEVAERLTEFVVIVSIMGAGLKLNRPVGWRSWAPTWRLLGITMPLTIAATALLGGVALGLPLAGALLLGAVLAPTDPVLASDVQVEGPDVKAERTPSEPSAAAQGDQGASEGEEEPEGDPEDPAEDADDQVRFALTSEAGLNDALAFPFTNLAIAIAIGGSWFGGWLLDDVVLKLTVGLVSGWAFGRVIAWLAFRFRSQTALAHTSEGFVAVGATLLVYGATELLHGYGFLAVFVAAVTIRAAERHHEYQQVLHDFAETVERLASIVFLVLLGGAVVEGALGALTVAAVAVAVALVLLVRPILGWLGLVGSPISRPERAGIAFFGIRGMGTIYYLAHAVTEERFPGASLIWAVSILVILLSIFVHGVAVSPVLRRLDEARDRGSLGGGAPAPSGGG